MTIEILNSDRDIIQQVNKCLANEYHRQLDRLANRIRLMTADHLMKSKTGRSLVSGQLRNEFGLTNPADKVRSVVTAFVDGISTENKTGSEVILVVTYPDVLTLAKHPAALQKLENGSSINWVDWLVRRGDSVIIRGYKFSTLDKGRTGNGIMVRYRGGRWRVPSEYSGTPNNNWFSRVLTSKEYVAELEKILGGVGR